MRRTRCRLPLWRGVLSALGWSAGVWAAPPPEPATVPPLPLSQPAFLPAGVAGQTAGGANTPKGAAEVEILHGTRRVWPPTPPRPLPVLVVPVPVAPAQTSQAVREDKKEPPVPVVESRTIILAGHMGAASPAGDAVVPAAPWLMPTTPTPPPFSWSMPPLLIPSPAPASTPVSPQVIVLREREGEPRSNASVQTSGTSESAGAVAVRPEWLVAVGTGLVGLGLGAWGWRRRRDGAGTRGLHPLPYVPMGGDGVVLMGRYNAGPRPATAEKFDIGPSYATLREEKKKAEAQSQQALVEFILGQNMALHAQLQAGEESLPLAEECAESAPSTSTPSAPA